MCMLVSGVCVHVHECAPFLRKGLLGTAHPTCPACLLRPPACQEHSEHDGACKVGPQEELSFRHHSFPFSHLLL